MGNRQGNNPIGNENINIGHDNWPAGTITGSSNITIGDASMTSLTSGSHNIGLGTTLTSVTTGEHNIGIGDDSLTNITGMVILQLEETQTPQQQPHQKPLQSEQIQLPVLLVQLQSGVI